LRPKDVKKIKELVGSYSQIIVLSELFGINLSEESEIIKDVLFKDHPDLVESFYEGKEIVEEDGTRWSPRLHIVVEAISESLIRNNEQFRNFFLSLINDGIEPHEARHVVGEVLIDLKWDILHPKGKLYGKYPNSKELDKLIQLHFEKIREEWNKRRSSGR
jgi:hypothetical protein